MLLAVTASRRKQRAALALPAARAFAPESDHAADLNYGVGVPRSDLHRNDSDVTPLDRINHRV